ncbi:heterokaryon incompatibility protein-domain-containing protein [Rostrohypoxylon terebratum]|nr:heterokaryon incompatibility protein-domain-containing protein [Rostrohypoxylon terebratum]
MGPYYPRLLDGDKFRLMLLHRGEWTSKLECNLVVRRLKEDLDYEALSYAWGSLRMNKSITVNGLEIAITANLETALRHIRREEVDVLLWVDALCINQKDKFERQVQVQIMRQIYNHDTRVVVFLGDGQTHLTPNSPRLAKPNELEFYGDSRDTRHIFQFLDRYKDMTSSQKLGELDTLCLVCLFAQLEPQYLNALIGLGDQVLLELFENLRMLVLSPWWTRMWTLQEIIVSQNALIRYGGCTAPWAMFTNAVVHNITPMLKGCNLSRDSMVVLNSFAEIVTNIQYSHSRWKTKTLALPDAGRDLHILLQSTYNRKSSDDQDRVYALLGLLSNDLGITPNYYAKTPDVYVYTVRAIIGATGSLDVLYGDLGQKTRNDLPSWVPDWGAPMHGEGVGRTRVVSKVYNACNGLKFNCWTSIDSFWDSLCADIQFGHSKNIRAPIEAYLRSRMNSLDSEEAEEDSVCKPNSNRLTIAASYAGRILVSSNQILGGVDVKALRSACCRWRHENFPGHTTQESQLDSQLDMATMRALVFDSKLTPCRGEIERLTDGDEIHVRQWQQAKISDGDQPYDEILGLDSVSILMSDRRRLFMNDTGAIGWGPDGLRSGDNIFVLPGGKTPFVIRGVDRSKYISTGRLIGDCFLQGAMDGELVNGSIRGDQGTAMYRENCAFEFEEILNRVQASSDGKGQIFSDSIGGNLEGFAACWNKSLEVRHEARTLAYSRGLKSVSIISLE